MGARPGPILASAQHAAVNFPQFPYMSFPPNMPSSCFGDPAHAVDDDPARALGDLLPPLEVADPFFEKVFQISSVRMNQLGVDSRAAMKIHGNGLRAEILQLELGQ